MRVVLKQPVAEKILEAIRDAKERNREIERIELTDAEFDELIVNRLLPTRLRRDSFVFFGITVVRV